MKIVTLISRFDLPRLASLLELLRAKHSPEDIYKMRGVLSFSLIPPKPLFPAVATSESVQFSIGDVSPAEFLQCSLGVAYASMRLRSAREETHSETKPACTSEAVKGKDQKAACTHSAFPIESSLREHELYVTFAPALGSRHPKKPTMDFYEDVCMIIASILGAKSGNTKLQGDDLEKLRRAIEDCLLDQK